ncbi:MAG: nucleotidyltransferase substrate binding protein [Myxococcota bacterium]
MRNLRTRSADTVRFQAGFQMGLIKEIEHELWLDAKRTRNLTSHTYKEELAAEVLEKIRNDYSKRFLSTAAATFAKK